MICSNCGFQNAPGDEFCGSCGQFLAWEGEQPASSEGEATPTTGEGQSTPPTGDQALTGGQLPADTTTGGGSAGAGQTQPFPPNWTSSTEQSVEANPAGGGTGQTTGGQAADSRTGGPALGTRPRLIRCPICGTANEPARSFCLKCGSRLGPNTRTARTRSPAPRYLGVAAVIVLVVVVLGAGFVVLGSHPASSPSPAGPTSSVPAVASSGAPSASVPAGGGTPPPASVEGSPPASFEPTPSGATNPPAGAFSCADQQLAASAPGRWMVTRARWGRQGPADYLAITLVPGADDSGSAAVAATLVQPSDVTTRFGVAAPASGDLALVLAFNGEVGFNGPFGSEIGYRALQDFRVARGSQKTVYVVIGVTGAGCYNLSSDGWTAGSRSSTELIVDIHK
jgi:predicted nucleic acid-binding Zn ribbon protein